MLQVSDNKSGSFAIKSIRKKADTGKKPLANLCVPETADGSDKPPC